MIINLTDNVTHYDRLKSRLIKIYNTLHAAFEEDIESGIDDKIYEAKENIDNRNLIEEAKKVIEEFCRYQPAIYMYVEEGQVQGMSATENVIVFKFDEQDYNATEGLYMDGLTPETWDQMIKEKTKSGEIKPIF